MEKNPYTGNRENKEKIIKGLLEKQKRCDNPSLRAQIAQDKKLLDEYKRKEAKWNKEH